MFHEFDSTTVETLSGARTLTVAEVEAAEMFSFDCGGAARTLTLPAEASCRGLRIFVANTSDMAEVLTIQDDGSNTICTPTLNESAILWCDGSAWHGLVGAES